MYIIPTFSNYTTSHQNEDNYVCFDNGVWEQHIVCKFLGRKCNNTNLENRHGHLKIERRDMGKFFSLKNTTMNYWCCDLVFFSFSVKINSKNFSIKKPDSISNLCDHVCFLSETNLEAILVKEFLQRQLAWERHIWHIPVWKRPKIISLFYK